MHQLLPSDHTTTMQRLRALMGPALHNTQVLALWDMGESNCQLLVSEGSTEHPMPVLHHLPLGLQQLTQQRFRNALPTETQLEAGIMEVEEAVMPLARQLPRGSLLVTHDPLLLHIARQATGQPALGSHAPAAGQAPDFVTREAVEALFEQLASQASRRHAGSYAQQPDGPRHAATLLILREALHHWQLERLYLLPTSVAEILSA